MRGREKIPHATIPVFVPHLGCPHRCSFCSQGVISGVEGAPTPQEAAERWGNTEAFLESREKHKHYTPDQEAAIQAEMEEIFRAFGACGDPEGAEAQALVRRWQAHITQHHYHCTDGILACLGEMYANDPRFQENLDQYGPGTAQRMSAAIAKFVQKDP